MFHSPKPARILTIALFIVAMVGSAACSSDGSEGNGGKTTTTAVGEGSAVTTGTEVGDEVTEPDAADPADPADPSDPGPSDDPQDYIDEFAVDISGGEVATKEQGECIGERWVEVVGFDAISAAGVSPSEFSNIDAESYKKLGLSDDDADSLYAAFADCGLDVLDSIRSSFGGDLSPTQQSCIDDTLTEELVKDLFTTNLLEGNDASTEDADALAACAEK